VCKYKIQDLLGIMTKLRGERGCPWDKAQTHETLRPYVVEEAYEVVDAIDRGNINDLEEELGDLLLQVVFHCRLAEESGRFTFEDVVDGVCKKMVRRHPHIFGDVKVNNSGEVLKNWEDIKQDEKELKSHAESMANIPKAMPALMRAFKVQEKAARVGFDWDDIDDVMNKVFEEVEELNEVYKGNNRDRIKDELGDLLFAVVNVSRFLGINPELAIEGTIQKFIRRFGFVEREALKKDKDLQTMTLQEMDRLWDKGKKQEKKF
jgi:tetrapyrrole methylase family protein/MazG family protein